MNIVQKFAKKTKELGISGTLRFVLKKAAGTVKCEEEIDTLYYLLNHYTDITKLSPAKGALRKLQLCDAVMLNIFDEICRREGWTYWLSWGTLLGAVRHRGFIPWDDDMDVSMPREDYCKAMKELPKIFASYGEDSLTLYADNDERLGFGYKHLQTGVWCDVFPVDTVYTASEDLASSRKSLAGKIRKYKKFYDSHKGNMSTEEIINQRKAIINAGGGCI